MFVFTAETKHFDTSLLSADFAKKSSLTRYEELCNAFPKVLIIFEHGGYYYGFNDTAVALYDLFGCRYSLQKGMLVAKIEKAKFESHMILKRRMRGFCYLIDRNGILTFEKGIKQFSLQKPMSYYLKNWDKLQNKKTATSYPIDKHGFGWLDDAWTPGLPSSRMYRKK